ncbi:ARG2 [Candida oxycetoniae]|uniref:ARG2 n=1 Tax=Candida oxycetoniae TaxID=497107 RepID=A0AAI9T0Y6_9ASCO|nr:ARG2 [Candida oxycetoniae]KAI3406392.2 ARG2 [Candida oxycetoniae]
MSKIKTLNRQFISNLETHKVITDAKRNLILSILKSTTTKREARNYLTKYQSQFSFPDLEFQKFNNFSDEITTSLSQRDNQRDLFVKRFLNNQNPFLNIYDEEETKLNKIPLRLAIFKIKFQSITMKQWRGIAETFKRLITLGVSPIILLDYDHLPNESFKKNELYMINQANKMLSILGKPEEPGDLRATVLRNVFNTKQSESESESNVTIDTLESILIPLYQGIIPIVQPISYNSLTAKQEFLKCDTLLSSLCSALIANRTTNLLSVEKIVMIDPLGGIPSIERNQTSHVFINLSQEYSDILSELYIGHIDPKIRNLHVNNLNSMNEILTFIRKKSGNDETTGIITTPEIMSTNDDQLNPIIYNVLTDRSIISSSLPSTSKRTPPLSTTIIKKGANVQIFDKTTFPKELTFERLFAEKLVDKDRLVNLLNDSFGKQLKVEEYFKRINNHLATFILVGDYDGAAVITYEEDRGGNKIAYLDKFAIAKKNQGLPVKRNLLKMSQAETSMRLRVNPSQGVRQGQSKQAQAGDSPVGKKRLAYYHELDEWQQDNHYIKSGYVKGTSSYRESLKSLGYLHNETVNIYSHLLPSSISFWLILYYINFQLKIYDNYLGVWEKLNFLQFGAACTFCMFMSSVFHCLKSHSHKVSRFGNQLDYFGIVILITCSLVSIVLFSYYDKPLQKWIFVGLSIFFGTVCTIFTLHPEFSQNYYRPFRSTMFILFGLSGVLPIANAVYTFGYQTTKERSGLIWLILEGTFYILGAVLYAMRFPERTAYIDSEEHLFSPGTFDIFGHSHQIFHFLVVVAAFCHWKALVECYHYLHQSIL